MYALKPDFEATYRRMEAFWQFDVLDRPVVFFGLERPPEERVPLPASSHATPADRWLDAEYQAELALARLTNREFLGDTLPVDYPRLGPEIFSALYGCPVHFGDYGTSWTDPILHDWARVDELQLDWEGPYLRKLDELTDALLEAARGRFIVGMADWHPGGDAIAALRDPQNLAVDMIAHVDEVKRLLQRLESDYFQVYDRYYHRLSAAGHPITTWLPLAYRGRYYVPSNDFSCMISTAMFEDVFLPGIVNECRFLDRSIYHLDGPAALRHLDSILAIRELHALQWVPGAGNEDYARWVWVYRRAQEARKGVYVSCALSDVPQVMDTLSPRGLCLAVHGVSDRESGLAMLRDLERWTARWTRHDSSP